MARTPNREALIAAAREATARSHAPYSGVHVGAAIRAASGRIVTGSNVENAAYPLGSCAESSAISAGVAAEGDTFRIAEFAVWAVDDTGRVLAASPCGGCRQRIQEFAASTAILIHFPWQGGEIRTCALEELLPFAFFLSPDRRP